MYFTTIKICPFRGEAAPPQQISEKVEGQMVPMWGFSLPLYEIFLGGACPPTQTSFDSNFGRPSRESRDVSGIVMAAVSQEWLGLRYASEESRADREVVMKVLSLSGLDLAYASHTLKGDPEIVKKAVSQNGHALQYATEEMRCSHEIVMIALQNQPRALQHAGLEWRGDRTLVKALVSLDWRVLEFATDKLRDDREIACAALSQTWMALSLAGPELQGDRDIVLTALSASPVALRYASEELQGDLDMIQAALATSVLREHPPTVFGVIVRLMSGRACCLLLDTDAHVAELLEACADALELEPAFVLANGRLMSGCAQLGNLQLLEPGELHELTLVLTT